MSRSGTFNMARQLTAGLLAGMLAGSCGRGEHVMPPAADLAPVQSIAGPSGAIACHVSGTGSPVPVVFVHSLAGSMDQWRPQIAHLRPSRRVVAIDLRGHGHSDPPSDGLYSPEAMAADIIAVMASLNAPRFVLVGHSYGGSVAVAVAGLRPSQVSGLLLVDANGDVRSQADGPLDDLITDLRSPEYELVIAARWEAVLKGAGLEVRRAVMDDLRRTPKATVVGAFEAMGTFDPITHLRAYDGPTLSVITPLNDDPMSLHKQMTLDRRLVLGTSHWLQMDKPDVINAILDEFLARVDRREP